MRRTTFPFSHPPSPQPSSTHIPQVVPGYPDFTADIRSSNLSSPPGAQSAAGAQVQGTQPSPVSAHRAPDADSGCKARAAAVALRQIGEV